LTVNIRDSSVDLLESGLQRRTLHVAGVQVFKLTGDGVA